MPVTVERGICPVTGRVAFALYDGEVPIVPATVYLRHLQANAGYERNTLAANAYALKRFFTFLEKERLSFWQIKVATVKQYKRFFLAPHSPNGPAQVKRRSAQQYLGALKGLIQYWRGAGDDDPLFSDKVSETDGIRRKTYSRRRFINSSWYARVPASLWRIRIPRKENHNKPRYKGLSAENCRAVMQFLNREPRSSDTQKMLYYRDRAIWTFLLMTGLRKGELCRIRLEDIDQAAGVVSLKDRPEDAWLGELKTGPGEIFVATNNPLWNYLNSWLLEGRWIAEAKLTAAGATDHEMLFCNRGCGPLTQPAVDNLFLRTKVGCRFAGNTSFHPHLARHTVATLMLNSGVELIQVQKFLRHRSITSTEIYGRVSDPNYRKALESFWTECEVLA